MCQNIPASIGTSCPLTVRLPCPAQAADTVISTCSTHTQVGSWSTDSFTVTLHSPVSELLYRCPERKTVISLCIQSHQTLYFAKLHNASVTTKSAGTHYPLLLPQFVRQNVY